MLGWPREIRDGSQPYMKRSTNIASKDKNVAKVTWFFSGVLSNGFVIAKAEEAIAPPGGSSVCFAETRAYGERV